MAAFDVFLSHASSDRELVVDALAELRRALPKVRFWVDFENLKPGDDWADQIVEAASGASLFLVFGTKAALESRWVQHEIGIGFQRRLFDKVPLVFLAFDPQVIPPELSRYQYIDFENAESGLQRLITFLDDQFRIRGRSVPQRPDPNIVFRRGPVLNFVSCPAILAALPRSELRRRICKGLSRKEVAVLWYDVLGGRMDDELPEQPLANCAMELLLRSDQRERALELFDAICNDYPHISMMT
jgi:hypothetical protein